MVKEEHEKYAYVFSITLLVITARSNFRNISSSFFSLTLDTKSQLVKKAWFFCFSLVYLFILSRKKVDKKPNKFNNNNMLICYIFTEE